jgi:methionyl-tRNA formyltransferase
MDDTRIAFFGTPDIAVWILEELLEKGIKPVLIVTAPDRPAGRRMTLTPPPVKGWAEAHTIPVQQPESLSDPAFLEQLSQFACDLFIVAAYGQMFPSTLLDIPQHGILNVHPSLLPKFRGASPIRSAILTDERNTGVTIMQMDTQMDHGPIVAQKTCEISKEEWPLPGHVLDERMARLGGQLLAEVIPGYVNGTVTPVPQNNSEATYCRKITKADGEINLGDDGYKNLLKIRAFDGWPGTFFFTRFGGKERRVKIVDAKLDENGTLEILRVIPEGKREMNYEEFLRTA